MTPKSEELRKRRDRDDSAYRAYLAQAIKPRPGYLTAAAPIPEPSSLPIVPEAQKRCSAWVTIVCQDCGDRTRIKRIHAGGGIILHRRVCPKRLRPASEKPHSRGKATARHKAPQRINRPRRAFCATCREELFRVNDAWKCLAGCTNVAD